MSFSQRSFRILINLFLLLLVVAIGFYWLNNTLQHRQHEIGEWLSETVGYPVEIRRSSLTWSVLSPKLLLEDVEVLEQDRSDNLLSLESIQLDLDLFASLWHRDISLDDISLKGLKLTVIRNGAGQLSLKGVETKGDSTPVFAGVLVRAGIIDSFHLTDITLNYIDQQQTFLSGRYRLNNGLVKHQGQRWNADALVILPPSLGNKVGIMASWHSQQQDNDWHWQIEADDLIADNLSTYLHWQGVSLTRAQLDVNLRGQGHSEKLTELTIDLDLLDAKLQSQSSAITNTVQIPSLKGQVQAIRQESGWSLEGKNVAVNIDNNIWPTTSFLYQQQGDNIDASGGFFAISDLLSIALLSESTPEEIQQIQPSGDIEQFAINYSQSKGLNSASISLRDGGVLPWQDYPGITGLTADINWQQDNLKVALDSHNVNLYPQNGYESALFFDSISGAFDFTQSEQQWQFQSQALRLWNDDLSIELDGSINQGHDEKIRNDLFIKLDDVMINQWKKYLPKDILRSNFKAWSANAFVDGKITHGEIKLKGDLAAFPYQLPADKQQGSFDLNLQVEGVQLHYAPEWPDIVNVNGTIIGSGNDLVIKSQQGTIAGFSFLNVDTRIDKLTEDEPILTLDGKLKGTTAQAVELLKNSPLRHRFGRVASLITAQGGSDINLHLMVPLSYANETEVKGDVSFINSTLFKTSFPQAPISNVNGKIDFSHESVSAESITAQALNAPIIINVGPKNNNTVINATGSVSAKQLELLSSEDLSQYINGQTDYELAVEISEKTVGDFYADVTVKSNLRGLNVLLPAPFYKTAEQTVDFQTALDQSVNSSRYTLDYDGKALASMLVTENTGRQFNVDLNKFNLADWLELQTANNESFFHVNDEVVFKIPQANIFGQQLTHIELKSTRQSTGWTGRLSSEQTNGSFSVTDDSADFGLIRANLDNVALTIADDKQPAQQMSQSTAALWPAIELDIDSLRLNQSLLGKLSLKSKRTPNKWILETASIQAPSFEANVLEGVWQKDGAVENTKLHIQVNSDDLANALASLGYQQAVDARNTKLDADISWPNDPLSFSKHNLRGKLFFDIGKGELEEVKPGAAGRVFGLLSFAAIPRRLALDFNDLFGKGFDFTSIKGSFDIANGTATTQDFTLNSEAAKIEISGPVDLVNQRYDQVVKVIPNVSSTLPLAGAVAGGPVGLGVGTAILLVDKLAGRLFDKQIVNLISYSYKLKGSWLNPELNIVAPVQP